MGKTLKKKQDNHMPEVALSCNIPVFLQLSCNLCYDYRKKIIFKKLPSFISST